MNNSGEAEASVWVDCESYESALASLSGIYEASPTDIETYLSTIDLDNEYERYVGNLDAGDLLQRMFDQKFDGPKRSVTEVSWFHLTRTVPGTSFSEGILPLGLALPKIWDMLVSILEDKRRRLRLKELRTNGVPNRLYQMKTRDKLHHGPYAMLVRESAFNSAEIGNHDYLRLPEIIEDICWGYNEKFNESIHEEIEAAMRPCIVKFTQKPRFDVTDVILRYCLNKAQNKSLHIHTNTCLDEGGATVPFEAIQKIEFL